VAIDPAAGLRNICCDAARLAEVTDAELCSRPLEKALHGYEPQKNCYQAWRAESRLSDWRGFPAPACGRRAGAPSTSPRGTAERASCDSSNVLDGPTASPACFEALASGDNMRARDAAQLNRLVQSSERGKLTLDID
jgi:hypothetical protein